jgi:Fic family protein
MLFDTPALGGREQHVLQQIDDLKTKLRWQLHEPRRWHGSLRRLSFARAIQGSNSIEGYDAALDDAAAVALGEDPQDVDEQTRLALDGYKQAMTYVLQLANEADMEYSVQLLKSLHFMMTGYSLHHRPGLWRGGSVYVRKEETGEIVYEAPDVDEVSALMLELVRDLNAVGDHPPIVVAAMAHLNLVMVHPFKDGNGRMARCLQSLVIARSGLLSPVFMSIEEYLLRNAQDYYVVLGAVGRGAWNPRGDARPWVRFLLTAHLRQTRTMLRRGRESERLWSELEMITNQRKLPDRVLLAMFDAANGLRIRNATYRANLKAADNEVTEQTASRDLRLLVDCGLLVARGEKRARTLLGRNCGRCANESSTTATQETIGIPSPTSRSRRRVSDRAGASEAMNWPASRSSTAGRVR